MGEHGGQREARSGQTAIDLAPGHALRTSQTWARPAEQLEHGAFAPAPSAGTEEAIVGEESRQTAA